MFYIFKVCGCVLKDIPDAYMLRVNVHVICILKIPKFSILMHFSVYIGMKKLWVFFNDNYIAW